MQLIQEYIVKTQNNEDFQFLEAKLIKKTILHKDTIVNW